jgi:hypothetical protein
MPGRDQQIRGAERRGPPQHVISLQWDGNHARSGVTPAYRRTRTRRTFRASPKSLSSAFWGSLRWCRGRQGGRGTRYPSRGGLLVSLTANAGNVTQG